MLPPSRKPKIAPPPAPREKPMAPIESRAPDGGADRATILVERDGKRYANDALKADRCRWPIGDPRSPDFHFCGEQAVPLKPYCEAHARKGFRTVAEVKAEARAVRRNKQLEHI